MTSQDKTLTLKSLPASAVHQVGKSDMLRRSARILWVFVLFILIALPMVPWQQSVYGSGRVIAYAPLERRQGIEAPIGGRVRKWYVQDGDQVKKGDPIAELIDNDPEIMRRLETERSAAQSQIDATALSMNMTQARVDAQKMTRDFAIDDAVQQIAVAEQKLAGATRKLDAAQASLRTNEQNLSRQRSLFEKGLSSQRSLELAQLSVDTSKASLDRAQADLLAAKADVRSKKAKRQQVAAAHQATIESTRASLEKLRGEKAKAQAEMAKVEVRLARQSQMLIKAPRDGTVLHVIAQEESHLVKAGELLVSFVPQAGSRAVELWVDGNDVPLLQPGREARIQFEGWPAVQFVGWPSVAVGSFAGKVAFVDAHDDGKGRFRVVLTPGEQEWPSPEILRQGAKAKAWILINEVSLGYEFWRQINGFPPTVTAQAMHKKKKK